MNTIKKALPLILLAVLAAACNMPSNAPSTQSNDDSMNTMVAYGQQTQAATLAMPSGTPVVIDPTKTPFQPTGPIETPTVPVSESATPDPRYTVDGSTVIFDDGVIHVEFTSLHLSDCGWAEKLNSQTVTHDGLTVSVRLGDDAIQFYNELGENIARFGAECVQFRVNNGQLFQVTR